MLILWIAMIVLLEWIYENPSEMWWVYICVAVGILFMCKIGKYKKIASFI